MAEESDHNSTMEAFETMLKDEQSRRFFELSPIEVPGSANETASSIVTTPDPLNTAFVGDIDNNEQCSQISLSQQQSQTTKETSSAIHHLIDTIIEQEHEIVSLSTPTKIIMTSTGTMPRTPIKMVSVGTMPKTPTMKSMGTMPTTIDLVSPSIETIDLCSPDTPTNTENSPSNSTPYMPPPPPPQ